MICMAKRVACLHVCRQATAGVAQSYLSGDPLTEEPRRPFRLGRVHPKVRLSTRSTLGGGCSGICATDVIRCGGGCGLLPRMASSDVSDMVRRLVNDMRANVEKCMLYTTALKAVHQPTAAASAMGIMLPEAATLHCHVTEGRQQNTDSFLYKTLHCHISHRKHHESIARFGGSPFERLPPPSVVSLPKHYRRGWPNRSYFRDQRQCKRTAYQSCPSPLDKAASAALAPSDRQHRTSRKQPLPCFAKSLVRIFILSPPTLASPCA
jgi:hypothetical protein